MISTSLLRPLRILIAAFIIWRKKDFFNDSQDIIYFAYDCIPGYYNTVITLTLLCFITHFLFQQSWLGVSSASAVAAVADVDPLRSGWNWTSEHGRNRQSFKLYKFQFNVIKKQNPNMYILLYERRERNLEYYKKSKCDDFKESKKSDHYQCFFFFIYHLPKFFLFYLNLWF